MNTQQACSLLGISVGASKDEVKKAFKKKAAEYHPDRNKAPDAETKFKTVNEAFQLLEKHGTEPVHTTDVSSEFYNHEDHLVEELRRHMNSSFNVHFRTNKQIFSQPIIVNVDVPFEMSVIGGKKEINYERDIKCNSCTDGNIATNKVMCPKCGGHGKRKYGNGKKTEDSYTGEDKELPCIHCKATGYISSTKTPCTECGGSGTRKSVDTLSVTIPPGVNTGLRLILRGKGNYTQGNYDNVMVVVRVLSDHDMQVSGGDVISVVELTLLEALKGTKKKLRTVKGYKTLAFKPKTRHRDTVRVSGFGVPPHGAHTFVVNVSYPEDISDLISTLEDKDDPDPEEISGEQS